MNIKKLILSYFHNPNLELNEKKVEIEDYETEVYDAIHKCSLDGTVCILNATRKFEQKKIITQLIDSFESVNYSQYSDTIKILRNIERVMESISKSYINPKEEVISTENVCFSSIHNQERLSAKELLKTENGKVVVAKLSSEVSVKYALALTKHLSSLFPE